MGEANFYYFTCLKLHLVFSGLQLFEREMANSLASVLVLATIAHLGSPRMMTGDWASKVCAAYYKASELGTFPPVYPGGFGWNDKVCLADPSFYLECKFVNGVFVGEKRQCPPGKLFYHGANPMWEKTCAPADRCKTNKCPDWLGMISPSPGPKFVHAMAEILPNNALPREDKKVCLEIRSMAFISTSLGRLALLALNLADITILTLRITEPVRPSQSTWAISEISNRITMVS